MCISCDRKKSEIHSCIQGERRNPKSALRQPNKISCEQGEGVKIQIKRAPSISDMRLSRLLLPLPRRHRVAVRKLILKKAKKKLILKKAKKKLILKKAKKKLILKKAKKKLWLKNMEEIKRSMEEVIKFCREAMKRFKRVEEPILTHSEERRALVDKKFSGLPPDLVEITYEPDREFVEYECGDGTWIHRPPDIQFRNCEIYVIHDIENLCPESGDFHTIANAKFSPTPTVLDKKILAWTKYAYSVLKSKVVRGAQKWGLNGPVRYICSARGDDTSEYKRQGMLKNQIIFFPATNDKSAADKLLVKEIEDLREYREGSYQVVHVIASDNRFLPVMRRLFMDGNTLVILTCHHPERHRKKLKSRAHLVCDWDKMREGDPTPAYCDPGFI